MDISVTRYSIPSVICPWLLICTQCISVAQSISPTDSGMAPSRILSAKKILAILGIRSMHYADYDCVLGSSGKDSCFTLQSEMWFDNDHMKEINYDPMTITTRNLKRGVMWGYLYNKLTYYRNMNLRAGYDMAIQAFLGSWLKEPYSFLRRDTIGD